jgi:hypothetical protein
MDLPKLNPNHQPKLVTCFFLETAGYTSTDVATLSTDFCANSPPAAAATASSNTLLCNKEVTLDGSGSSDPDAGDVLTYDWAVYDTANNMVLQSQGPIYTIPYAQLTAGKTYTVSVFGCCSSGLQAVREFWSGLILSCKCWPTVDSQHQCRQVLE